MLFLPRDIRLILEDCIPRLNTALRLDRVILYGSYSKGTFTKDSDIDLAIFIPDVCGSILDAYRTAVRICCAYGKDIQPQIFFTNELDMPIGIIEEILANGRDVTFMGKLREI